MQWLSNCLSSIGLDPFILSPPSTDEQTVASTEEKTKRVIKKSLPPPIDTGSINQEFQQECAVPLLSPEDQEQSQKISEVEHHQIDAKRSTNDVATKDSLASLKAMFEHPSKKLPEIIQQACLLLKREDSKEIFPIVQSIDISSYVTTPSTKTSPRKLSIYSSYYKPRKHCYRIVQLARKPVPRDQKLQLSSCTALFFMMQEAAIKGRVKEVKQIKKYIFEQDNLATKHENEKAIKEYLFTAILALLHDQQKVYESIIEDKLLSDSRSLDPLYCILVTVLAEKNREKEALSLIGRVTNFHPIPTKIIYAMFEAAKALEENKEQIPASPRIREKKKKKTSLFGLIQWEYSSAIQKEKAARKKRIQRVASLERQRKASQKK